LEGTVAPSSGGGRSRLLVTTKIEHAAIREPVEALAEAGVDVVYLPTDADGVIDPADLATSLKEHACDRPVTLVSVQWANNETGVIQPIAALSGAVGGFRESELARHGVRSRVLFHTDATQAVGKLPVAVGAAGVDLLTLAAHKFHGPKGAGALFVRQGVRLRPQNRGGPQERERRGGTENTPGIVGMGVAADLARQFLTDTAGIESLRARRDRLERGIADAWPDTVVNSGGAARLWNTTNLGFPRLEAEAILLGLSERGVCASAGAACSSGSLDPSPVLLAMGVPEPVAHGSIRLSISRWTTDDEIDRAVAIVPEVVRRLARSLPTGRPQERVKA